MNRKYIYFGVGLLILGEIGFYILIKTVTDFDKIISSQKELLEIFGLIVVLLSGKLIIDGISYIKESNIKNLKETLGLINEYDGKIEIFLENLDEFHGKESEKTYLQSISLPKLIIFLDTLNGIIDNSLINNHKELFTEYITHIYFKIYLQLLKKKYLSSERDGKIRFVGSVESQILHQMEQEKLDKFLRRINKFKKKNI